MGLLAILALVLANGFFVAAELALLAVRRTRVQQLAVDGSRRAQQVLTDLDHLDTSIAATRLGITVASLGLGWSGQPAVATRIEPLMRNLTFLPAGSQPALTQGIAFAIAFSLLATLHLVLGVLVPGSVAARWPERTALWVAAPLRGFALLARPAIHAVDALASAIVRLLRIAPGLGQPRIQVSAERREAENGNRETALSEDVARDLVDRALLFRDLEARHAMVPRTEMVAIPLDASLDQIVQIALRTGHTRLPVYRDDIDHVVGVVDVRRLLARLAAGRLRESHAGAGDGARRFRVSDLMNEMLAVPETAPASALLTRLRGAKTPMAVVIDEYGGTAGLVTLVDLVESLVGDFEGEVDPIRLNGRRTADGSFSLDGLTTLLEAKEFYDLDLEDGGDVDTVGGYVFSRLGRPAAVGDEVLAPQGQLLITEELDGLRVARVRVVPPRAELAPVALTAESAA